MFKPVLVTTILIISLFQVQLLISQPLITTNVMEPLELRELKKKEEKHRKMYLKLRRKRRILRKKMARELAKIRKITRKQERKEKKDLRKRQKTEIKVIKKEFVDERRRLYNEIARIKKEIRLLRKNYRKDIRNASKRHKLERKELRKKQLERRYEMLTQPEKVNEIKPISMKQKLKSKNNYNAIESPVIRVNKKFNDNRAPADPFEADFKGSSSIETITTPET